MNCTSKLLGAASALVLVALGASPAFAAGTTAGSTITNTASISYQVGGITQNSTTASDTLTVDRKINLTVAEVGTTTTQVSPGQTSAVTTFLVSNTSNAALDFSLAATQIVGGTAVHGGTDTFDVTNVKIYADTNSSGVYDAGDTLVTYLDEVAADSNRTVFVVADVPLGLVNAAVAGVSLAASAREAGGTGSQGAAVTQTSGANTSSMDTVFADGAGATDALRDGAFSAKDDYTVFAALLSVLKSSSIISDPVNGTTNPKMIPGATIQYCIAVTNGAGGADATSVVVNDPLPTTITYDSTFGVKLNGTVTSGTCNLDGAGAGAFGSGAVTGTLTSVPAASTKTVVFRATIN